VIPRLWTPPLRELTAATSYGFDFADFCAEVLQEPLDPWQKWASIHVGELLPDGRPRFRTALVIVARQQGKTSWCRALTLYWLFVDEVPLVLGTSTNREYAKESWRAVVAAARRNRWLNRETSRRGIRETNGEECFTTARGSRYEIAASNRRGGRSKTVHRLILDELREHADWSAWGAASNATNAVATAQIVAITNQGDERSVVLDSLRTSALEHIETGAGDPRLGLFEWSAPAGAEPTDLDALAQANPDLGRRTDPDALMGAALRARNAGGEELATFRTEVMCMRVRLLDPAIDPDRWATSGTDTPLDLAAEHREQVALCYDVSLDGLHACLVAAAVVDGRVHAEVVQAWDGAGCTQQLRRELPDLVRQVKPRVLGWFPSGPAAAVAADLADRKQPGQTWPPRRVKIEEIKGEAGAVCMGLAEQVQGGEIVHPRDPMLTLHVESAQKLRRGDAWVFTRRGTGPIDGAYALAGAVHLARTLPPPPPPLVVVTARR
jgi:hypothetical protein